MSNLRRHGEFLETYKNPHTGVIHGVRSDDFMTLDSIDCRFDTVPGWDIHTDGRLCQS